MRIKRRLRTAVERAAHWSGVLSRFERRARSGLTILTYHRVLPDERCRDYPFPALAMPVTAFRAQMECLARRCEVLPVGPALERSRSGDPSRRPLVAVTFDDGYDDNHDVVAPILQELGLRATFFVVSGFVGDRRELWFDRAARAQRALGRTREESAAEIESLKASSPLERDQAIEAWASAVATTGARSTTRAFATADGGFAPMSPADVRALAEAGHEIAAHTVSHAILPTLDDAALDAELATCRRDLESAIGSRVDGLAYPNGDHDERVLDHARRAGYRWACTTIAGRNERDTDALRLRRIDVTPTRVLDHHGDYSEIAFRSEVSLLRGSLRRVRRAGGGT